MTGIPDKQVDMIGRRNVIQNREPKPLAGLKQPVFPAPSIPFKFEQELSIMTTMGDMPYDTRREISICSWLG